MQVLVIVKDIAGYELCLVSSETFFPSVRMATDFVGPDWAARALLSGGSNSFDKEEL